MVHKSHPEAPIHPDPLAVTNHTAHWASQVADTTPVSAAGVGAEPRVLLRAAGSALEPRAVLRCEHALRAAGT